MTELPMAPLLREPSFNPMLIGRRARHKHLGVYGRLTGELRYDRDQLWAEVECESGRWWWVSTHIQALGPIPMPAPGFPRGKAS